MKRQKLTEEQEILLGLVPEGFEGTLSEKLIYGLFCHCNNVAINRGKKTFTLGYKTMIDRTGLGRTVLSTVINKFIAKGLIGRCEIGCNFNKKNSEYYTFVNTASEHCEVNTVNASDTGTCEKVNTMVNTASEHCEVNTKLKYNSNYNDNSNVEDSNMIYMLKNMLIKELIPLIREELLRGELMEDMLKEEKFINMLKENLKEEKAACMSDTTPATTDEDISTVLKMNRELEAKIASLSERIDKAGKTFNTMKKEIESLKAEVQSLKADRNNTSTADVKHDKRNTPYSIQYRVLTDFNADINTRIGARDAIQGMIERGELTEKQIQTVIPKIESFNAYLEKKNGKAAPTQGRKDKPFNFTKKSHEVACRLAEADRAYTSNKCKKTADDYIAASEEMRPYIERGEAPEVFIDNFNKGFMCTKDAETPLMKELRMYSESA